MPFAEENKQPPIYYETSGVGKAIIFIPPPGVGHLTFRYQQALMDEFTVITFDIRGDCRSGRSSLPMTMDQLVNDVKRVLDANNIHRAIICGYSNGACIAQEFALTYPNRTEGLILISGYFAVRSFLLKKEYQLGIWIAKNRQMRPLAFALAKNHFENNNAARKHYKEIKQTDSTMLASQYYIGLHYSCADRLHHLKVPTLLIYGSKDYYIQPYQFLYRKQVKDVEVVYVDKSKHQVPTRYSKECNAVIREWVRRKQ